MCKNELQGKPKWPKNCIWPAPIGKYGGIDWDEEIIPNELDSYTEELVDIKDYYDLLVDEGILDEEYRLIPDSYDEDQDEWQPEFGTEFWDSDRFDIEYWRDQLTDALNQIKIDVCDSDPTINIYSVIHYRFINENLLRQAFTRRAFQIEYGLSGCSEELEFIGDAILSQVVTKELMKHYASVVPDNTSAPFQTKMNEGDFSRIRAHYVCKEHLAKRCVEMGLNKYILYGTGEVHNEASHEDTIEALIGAVAIDSNYDESVLEDVIDRLVDIQINESSLLVKKSYYDILNSWHMRQFGCLPEYEVYRNVSIIEGSYSCVIKFMVPDNDKGVWTAQVITSVGDTRSRARTFAAELAYRFIVDNGLWMNLKDAGVEPDYEKSINQLQELYQKKYIEQPIYDFWRDGKDWYCNCHVNDISVECRGYSKVVAKKLAAYKLLINLLRSAGCCEDEWMTQMLQISENLNADVIYTPAKEYVGGLKYSALVDILKQIPSGKVITEKSLLKYLSAKYKVENLQTNVGEIPNIAIRDRSIPWHRYLTATGLVNEYYRAALIEEGHNVVETKTYNCRVLDYKETSVDLQTIVIPDKELAIGPEGHFMENVSEELKAQLVAEMKKRGFM